MTDFDPEHFDAEKYLDELVARRQAERLAMYARASKLTESAETRAPETKSKIEVAQPAPAPSPAVESAVAESTDTLSSSASGRHASAGSDEPAPSRKSAKATKSSKRAARERTQRESQPKPESRPKATKQKQRDATPAKARRRRIAWIVTGIIAAVLVGATALAASWYSIETVDSGMNTSAGASAGRMVIVDTRSPVHESDLVVGQVSTGAGEASARVIGTVYAMNDQTIALFDGKLIWQVPLDHVDGKVMFLSPQPQPPSS